MAIYQILLFLLIQPYSFLQSFFRRTLFFFTETRWFTQFSRFFGLFFVLHACLLFLFYSFGYVVYQPGWGVFSVQLVAKTLFGLFVVFMLAWTEELIFRGTLYPYFEQYYKPITSLFLTSFLFMLVHNLKNPLALVTSEWKLGLGLFLLGVLLNQIFIITGKLYTGMGAHAGLVFVKVVLRRARFLVFVPGMKFGLNPTTVAWIHPDLRQSHIVHILFILVIASLFVKYWNSFLTSSKKISKPLLNRD